MKYLPEDILPIGSAGWWLFAGVAVVGRTADLISTYVATPNLALEGNPIARKLGWKIGIPLNFVVALATGCQPLLSVAITTTSLLVAARNFQNAWLMRSMGEWRYRLWISERLDEGPPWLAAVCFLAEAGLTSVPGLALMIFSNERLIPFGVGLGMAAYSAAVALFTMLALWRRR